LVFSAADDLSPTQTSIPNAAFDAELSTLRHKLQDAERERDLANQKLRETEFKANQLHKLILKSGLGSSGPTDEEIQKRFSALRHDIFQFVKRYCTNPNVRPKDSAYSGLSSEAKDFWAMGLISRGLHAMFFKEGNVMFGLDRGGNDWLNHFYLHMSKSQSGEHDFNSKLFSFLTLLIVPTDEMREWRARTSIIGKAWDHEKRYRQERAEDAHTNIWRKITSYMPSNRPSFLSQPADEAKSDLVAICLQAHDLAQMFDCTTIEYRWNQGEDVDLEPSRVKTVGSAGYHHFVDKPGGFKIVFGGVVKGGGPSGRLAEETVHLTETEVLLGPFRD